MPDATAAPAAPRELTLRAIAFGLAAGALFAATNVYAGTKLGYIDYGTMTIVLLAFAAFGAGRRRFTPQEANIAQVVGTSAGAMALSAGVVGPVPALEASGLAPSLLVLVPWAIAVAALGTLVALPLRRAFVAARRADTGEPALAFPSATAAGVVIRKLFGDEPGQRGGIALLGAAALAAAALTFARDELRAFPSAWLLPLAIGGVSLATIGVGVAASPLVAGVGLLLGARLGLSILLGTAIAWIAIAPALVAGGHAAPEFGALVSWTLWPGAALMLAGSLTSLALDARHLAGALRAVRANATATGTGPAAAGTRAARAAWLAAVACALALIAIGWLGFGVSPLYAIAGVAVAVIAAPAAIHATGETDNTPSGPFGGVMQLLAGAGRPSTVAAPLQAGGIVNGVATHAAILANAWRTGEIVGGASPARIAIAQLAGIPVGVAVAFGVYALIAATYGIGSAEMPAPGAASWRATAAVAQGLGALPPGAPIAALVGAAAGVALELLSRPPRGATTGVRARLAGAVPSPVALGMGFLVHPTVGIGLAIAALAGVAISRRAPAWHAERIPVLAAGLIVGEAVLGIALAAVAVLRG